MSSWLSLQFVDPHIGIEGPSLSIERIKPCQHSPTSFHFLFSYLDPPVDSLTQDSPGSNYPGSSHTLHPHAKSYFSLHPLGPSTSNPFPPISNPPTSGCFAKSSPPHSGLTRDSHFGSQTVPTLSLLSRPPPGWPGWLTKRFKGVKASSKKISLTFGDEIHMGDVIDTSECVLVGQVIGMEYSATWMRQCVLEIWG